MATQETRSMVSEVSICNQALSYLKVAPIISLADNSEEAEWCDRNYVFVRDAVIEETSWSFARDRKVSTSGDLDPFGVQYRHPIPPEWLQVFQVYNSVSGSDPQYWTRSDGWVREGANVLADETTVYMAGVIRVTDTGKFSQLFVQALATRLAAEAAIPLKGDSGTAQMYWKLYDGKIRMAKVRDSQQGANQVIKSNALVDARYTGGRGRY